ncbi:hypothetical protein FIBSPDRAFT_946823 [Athelia psychrophila]|uniref:Uncharacterized protein n=1 Tax=Athelia psychrophila TaxID=1759441 RepID=A0A166SKX1_9AGAM|nr:hypothetical protein FIBSPDRAFT_946823 [Fibularhizoctonia sp. CBS 109695]
MEPITDSGFWRPSPGYQPPVPAPTSPAAAMVEGNQEAFLLELEHGQEYAHIKEEGFFPGFPTYLRWWFHQSCLPQVFHTMDLIVFKALLVIVTNNVRSSGTCSHGHLLALGLISRDIEKALGGPDEDHLMLNLTPEHAAAFLAVMQDLAGICKTKSMVLAVDPEDCTTDNIGYIWRKGQHIATGEDRSPAASSGNNKTSVPFMKGLTTCQAYQHAIMAGASKVDPKVTSMMSQLSHTMILHTHLLAFGLAMRDIEAAINTRNGGLVDPPFILESSLDQNDLHYVIEKLKGLMARAGHGAYLPKEQGPSRIRSGVQ